MFRGAWHIIWYEHGTRRRISAGTANPTIARQSLADFEASLIHRPDILTVTEALSRYCASRDGKIMAHDRILQAAKHLAADIGPLRVDQMNQARWDGYRAGRITKPRPREFDHKPRPVASGTLRREYTVLRAALRLAWKDGFLLKPPQIEPPAESQSRDRYLTKDEARALIQHAHTLHVRVFVALAIYTGARRGAILGLTWDRVQNGIIDFQEPGRQLTAKRRSIVPVNPQLAVILAEAQAAAVSDHVVEWQGRAVPTGLRWSWAKLCVASGLTWKPTPHHIKHSAASWMAMDGVQITQAADWLATDERTLRKVYRKFDPAYLRSVMGALDL